MSAESGSVTRHADHFSCPQSILSDALLWYGSQFGAIPGGGSKFRMTAVEPAFRQAS
jgi:hypothetical protein